MEISTIIKTALKNGLPEEEYLQFDALGRTSDEDRSCLEKCSIRATTLYDFRTLLFELSKLFESFNETLIPKVLNHENAHANMAESVGAVHDGYIVTFLRKKDGFRMIAQAVFHHPIDWLSDKKRLADLILIFSAPNKYGDVNSDSDNRKIAELKLLLTAHEK